MERLFFTFYILLFSGAWGQDINFSQFYSSPQLLNPASTGDFNFDYRLSTQHREQWGSINSMFKSDAFGVEFNLREGRLKQNKIGLGAQGYIDNESDIFNSKGFRVCFAYHKSIGKRSRHHFSLGVHPEYYQESLNTDGLKFGNQYQGYQFSTNISHGENLSSYQKEAFLMHFGLKYQYDLSKKSSVSTGLAAHQLFSTVISSNSHELQNVRYVAHLSSYLFIDKHLSVSPVFLFSNQSGAYEVTFGSLFTYKLLQAIDLNLVLGAMYRWNDAFITPIGLEFRNISAQLSYDTTISELSRSKNPNSETYEPLGAWEFSLIFKGVFRRQNYSNEYHMPCTIL